MSHDARGGAGVAVPLGWQGLPWCGEPPAEFQSGQGCLAGGCRRGSHGGWWRPPVPSRGPESRRFPALCAFFPWFLCESPAVCRPAWTELCLFTSSGLRCRRQVIQHRTHMNARLKREAWILLSF